MSLQSIKNHYFPFISFLANSQISLKNWSQPVLVFPLLRMSYKQVRFSFRRFSTEFHQYGQGGSIGGATFFAAPQPHQRRRDHRRPPDRAPSLQTQTNQRRRICRSQRTQHWNLSGHGKLLFCFILFYFVLFVLFCLKRRLLWLNV